jgi:putative endonuclease
LADWSEYMIYTVYVLKDEAGKHYTGYTGNIEKRLWEHNHGITTTTKKGNNWKLIYQKEFENKSEAILHERYLKTGKGREYLHHCGIV